MSASTDTSILIWDLKGEILSSINTNQIVNSYAAISPCGRSVPLLRHIKPSTQNRRGGGDDREQMSKAASLLTDLISLTHVEPKTSFAVLYFLLKMLVRRLCPGLSRPAASPPT